MDELERRCDITEHDLKMALADLKGYVDVTDEDLMKIFSSALVHAKRRMQFDITVEDLMTKDVVTVQKEASLEEAARRLTGLRISGMPVVDDKDIVIGVVGELDLITAVGGEKGSLVKNMFRRMLGEPVTSRKEGSTVGEVMSTPPITIRPQADIREAAHLLERHRIKRLPVVDEFGRLIGVISRADIVRGMSKSMHGGKGKHRHGKVHEQKA
jgi:CBS-domain-containing membrane protein